MSIAYIIDSSTEVDFNIQKQGNIFVLPFKGYDNEGNLKNITTTKQLKEIQNNKEEGSKQFIEPTPGIYRDLYKKLKQEGYDYVVCIPQNKNNSSSYLNAEYASRFYQEFVVVLDSVKYDKEPKEILMHLLEDKKIKDDSIVMELDFDKFIEFIINLINKTKIVSI